MSLQDIIISVGIPAIIVGLISIGRKLQILDDLKITNDKIKHNLKVISEFLIRGNKNFNSKEIQVISPYTLTEVGENFIKEVGFNNVFNANKEDFFLCIENEKPKLKYDVEAAAIKSVSMLYDKEYMNFLKVYFYNNPTRSIENAAPTLGIYIRDKYLAEHPEITQ